VRLIKVSLLTASVKRHRILQLKYGKWLATQTRG
jgi:hypothetical protein